MNVMIGIDPHKASHTAVAIGGDEGQLSSVKVREISYLDSPYREALAGFMARQPRFYSGLDGSGAVEMRDFASIRDLHLSYAILDQIDSAAELFRAMFAIDISSPNFRAPSLRSRSIFSSTLRAADMACRSSWDFVYQSCPSA